MAASGLRSTAALGLATLLCVAALGGCGKGSAPETAPKQDSARTRIISLGGSVTEIVYALGDGPRLIGADISSTYPTAATKVSQVGYQRTVAAESILALEPTLVLATEEAGPKSSIEQIRQSGVTVEIIPSSEHSLEGVKKKVLAVGKALGRSEAARKLVDSIDRTMASAKEQAAASGTTPSVMFIYTRGPGGAQISGHGTAADAMIALAGGRNAVTGYEGYKPLTSEAVLAADPEVILVPSQALAGMGGIDALLRLPGIGETRAGRARRVVAMDDLYLLGFGPRIGQALSELVRALHTAPAGAGS